MSTTATLVEQNEAPGPSVSNPDAPQSQAPKRKRLPNPVAIAGMSKAKKKRKFSSVTKIPHIPEFGSYPPSAQYGKFREWIKKVKAGLKFVDDWTEELKANWFAIVSGKNLQDVIMAYRIKPKVPAKPFSSLIRALDIHFESLADPTLDNLALESCSQETGESANDFYVRLMSLTQHMSITKDRVDSHFASHLVDSPFKSTAITNGWTAAETVAAATRNEVFENLSKKKAALAASVNMVQSRPVEQATVNAVSGSAESVPRQNFQPEPNRFRGNEAASRRGFGKQRQQQQQKCPDCGIRSHNTGRCPALGKKCLKCGKWDHFARVCPSAGGPGQGNTRRRDQVSG